MTIEHCLNDIRRSIISPFLLPPVTAAVFALSYWNSSVSSCILCRRHACIRSPAFRGSEEPSSGWLDSSRMDGCHYSDFFVSFRLFTRYRENHHLLPDDYWVVLGWTSSASMLHFKHYRLRISITWLRLALGGYQQDSRCWTMGMLVFGTNSLSSLSSGRSCGVSKHPF